MGELSYGDRDAVGAGFTSTQRPLSGYGDGFMGEDDSCGARAVGVADEDSGSQSIMPDDRPLFVQLGGNGGDLSDEFKQFGIQGRN